MSSWGIADAYTSAPLWAAASVKLAPTSANVQNLFEDEVADNFITGATIGLYNLGPTDLSNGYVISVDGSTQLSVDGTSHTGWVLRTAGSGGRNNRVQTEVLVALTSNS